MLDAERGQVWTSYQDIPRGMFITVRGDVEDRDGKQKGNKVRWASVRHRARYVDEQGVLIAELWRYEEDAPDEGKKPTKLVLPRAPLGDGRWIGNLNGRSLPLYNLPRLQSARPDAVIFVTEGEKKADRLQAALDAAQAEGVVVCAALGSKSWHRAVGVENALKQRQVVILPDNDDAGQEHTSKVRDSLAGIASEIRVVQLPGLGNKEDVADWLARGGTISDLLRLVEETPPHVAAQDELDESDIPDVVRTARDVDAFPCLALPAGMRAFVMEGAEAINCPPDLLAIPALVAASAAIGTSCVIEVKPGYPEQPILYAAIVARPGEAKSPAMKAARTPLEDADRRAQRQYRQAREQWEQLAEAERGPRPRLPQHIVRDTTIEALADVLAANPRGVLIERDELSGWIRSMDQYRTGKGADRAYWLSAWSSSPVTINRRSRGGDPLVLDSPFASLIGGIQPDLLSEICDERGREDGFIHRFLFAYPRSHPFGWTETYVSDEVKARYDAMFRALLALQPDVAEDGSLIPRVIPFSPEGKRTWLEWLDGHVREVNAPGFAESLRGPWVKLVSYAARIALIVHMCRVADRDPDAQDNCVDEVSMAAAAAIVEYFKSHTRRVYAQLHADPEDFKIARALAWIREQPGPSVKARDLQAFLNHTFHGIQAHEVKQLLTELAERGYGRVEEVSPPHGRKSFQFFPNERLRSALRH